MSANNNQLRSNSSASWEEQGNTELVELVWTNQSVLRGILNRQASKRASTDRQIDALFITGIGIPVRWEWGVGVYSGRRKGGNGSGGVSE